MSAFELAPAGVQGPVGPTGPTGATGAQGPIGSGVQGPPGPGVWPSRQTIWAYAEPSAQLNFDNLGANADTSALGERFSDGNNGDWAEWLVPLAAGAYELIASVWVWNGAGIQQWTLDGDVIATYDAYSGSLNKPIPVVIASGYEVEADGYHALRVTATGKNAASGGYMMTLAQVVLEGEPDVIAGAGGGSGPLFNWLTAR